MGRFFSCVFVWNSRRKNVLVCRRTFATPIPDSRGERCLRMSFSQGPQPGVLEYKSSFHCCKGNCFIVQSNQWKAWYALAAIVSVCFLNQGTNALVWKHIIIGLRIVIVFPRSSQLVELCPLAWEVGWGAAGTAHFARTLHATKRARVEECSQIFIADDAGPWFINSWALHAKMFDQTIIKHLGVSHVVSCSRKYGGTRARLHFLAWAWE